MIYIFYNVEISDYGSIPAHQILLENSQTHRRYPGLKFCKQGLSLHSSGNIFYKEIELKVEIVTFSRGNKKEGAPKDSFTIFPKKIKKRKSLKGQL